MGEHLLRSVRDLWPPLQIGRAYTRRVRRPADCESIVVAGAASSAAAEWDSKVSEAHRAGDGGERAGREPAGELGCGSEVLTSEWDCEYEQGS